MAVKKNTKKVTKDVVENSADIDDIGKSGVVLEVVENVESDEIVDSQVSNEADGTKENKGVDKEDDKELKKVTFKSWWDDTGVGMLRKGSSSNRILYSAATAAGVELKDIANDLTKYKNDVKKKCELIFKSSK